MTDENRQGSGSSLFRWMMGCLGALVVLTGLVLGGVVYGGVKLWEWGEDLAGVPPEPDPAFDQHWRDWASMACPEALDVHDDLELEIELQRRSLEKLAATLREMGRRPDRDADHGAWTENLAVLERKAVELAEIIQEAYLSSRKYDLSRQEEVDADIERALAAAREAARFYERLRQAPDVEEPGH